MVEAPSTSRSTEEAEGAQQETTSTGGLVSSTAAEDTAS